MNKFTHRSLGLNFRKLGLSLKSLSNKSDKELAQAYRNAALILIDMAKKLESS